MSEYDLLYYSHNDVVSENVYTSHSDDISTTVVTQSEVKKYRDISPNNTLAIIFEADSYSDIREFQKEIRKKYPTLPQILITPPSKQVLCEEKGERLTSHISNNNPDLNNVVATHIDALVTELQSGMSCGPDLIKMDDIIDDIQNTFLNNHGGKTNYTQNVKPYIRILSEHSNINDCIVTYNDIDDAGTTRIISSTLDSIEDNVIKTTNEFYRDNIKNKENITKITKHNDEYRKLLPIIPYDYSTHISSPIPLSNSTSTLHIIDKTERIGNLDDRTISMIRMISHMISREIERIQTNNELVQNIEILQKFRYTISHDLMSPVSTAKGRTEIAKSKFESDHIDIAYDAIERVETMINSTERLLSAGESINVNDRISMEKTCKEAWKIIDVSKAELNVRNDFELYADVDQLKTILENIFKNSIEHGGRDVTIDVYKRSPIRTSTREDPDKSFSFVIEDNGNGIPDDMENKMFKKKETTKDNQKVSGFGLSIVKSSVEAHGWEINVGQSSTGAKFIISNVR